MLPIRFMPSLALVAASLAALVAPLGSVRANDVVKGDMAISQPWTRATPGGAKVGAGYVTITNRGTAPDRLVGGTAIVSGNVEIHATSVADGVMRMRQLEKGIEIRPGETIELKPGGMHLMLMELKKPMTQGERIKGTLVFERAGIAAVEFDVAPIGAPSPDAPPAAGAGGARGGNHHH